jgi:hypothetical protein
MDIHHPQNYNHQISKCPAWSTRLSVAKAEAKAVGGLPKHKVCLGGSLDPQPRGPSKSHSRYYCTSVVGSALE